MITIKPNGLSRQIAQAVSHITRLRYIGLRLIRKMPSVTSVELRSGDCGLNVVFCRIKAKKPAAAKTVPISNNAPHSPIRTAVEKGSGNAGKQAISAMPSKNKTGGGSLSFIKNHVKNNRTLKHSKCGQNFKSF